MMKFDPEFRAEEGTLRQYLMGGLSEPEQTQVEERIFTDEAFYQQLCVTEDALIDAYAGERLSVAERARFEEQFLTSPRRRARVEFARVLRDSLGKSSPPQRTASADSWWATLANWIPTSNTATWIGSAAAALLVLMVVGGLLYGLWHRTRPPLPPTQARAPQQRNPALSGPAQRPAPSNGNDARVKQLQARLEQTEAERRRLQRELAQGKSMSSLLFSFVLTPGLVRDEKGLRQLSVPDGEGMVQLQLELETEQPGPYRAVLQTIDGVDVWSQNRAITERAHLADAIVLRLPARLLRPNDYHLTLSRRTSSGIWEEAGDYFFRVARNG